MYVCMSVFINCTHLACSNVGHLFRPQEEHSNPQPSHQFSHHFQENTEFVDPICKHLKPITINHHFHPGLAGVENPKFTRSNTEATESNRASDWTNDKGPGCENSNTDVAELSWAGLRDERLKPKCKSQRPMGETQNKTSQKQTATNRFDWIPEGTQESLGVHSQV